MGRSDHRNLLKALAKPAVIRPIRPPDDIKSATRPANHLSPLQQFSSKRSDRSDRPKAKPRTDSGKGDQTPRLIGSDRSDRLEVPLRTGRGQNDREHHFARARRIQKERKAVHLLWPWSWRQRAWIWPVVVLLERVKPRGEDLDDDNLRASLKAVRDQVAAELGVDDGDRARIRFEYAEARGSWGVRIHVREVTP